MPISFTEKQYYLSQYSFFISLVSPTASAYQLLRLNPQVKITTPAMVRTAFMILPHQTALKLLQMNCATPIKENLNVWASFAAVGVMQGGVYGQANIHFANSFGLSKGSILGAFRGSGFAAIRDMKSQGIPFVFSSVVRKNIVEPVLGEGEVARWTSVIGTSIFATYASQGLHNCQITMQADQSLSYAETLSTVWKKHGISVFYRGGEARVGLLLLVCVLNESVLKMAWR